MVVLIFAAHFWLAPIRAARGIVLAPMTSLVLKIAVQRFLMVRSFEVR